MNKLIVGLGNPGSKYERTRHNIGEQSINYTYYGKSLTWQNKFKGIFSSFNLKETKFYFLKPLTYMNLSGESVIPLAQFFKIDVKDIMVIHDELDLSFGNIGFKKGGGLAGHNGLKSIASLLGSQDFLRLRIGIGRPTFADVSSHVLSPFSPDENISLSIYLEKIGIALDCYIENGIEKASLKYNKKPLIDKDTTN